MNKRGIGVGQVFVFIIAALSFALIMIFGYKVITDFLEKGENVEFIQFKSDLENSIKGIYTDYGSVRKETFRLPPKYEQICFIDLSAEDDQKVTNSPELCEKWDPIACQVWEESAGYQNEAENVFLEPIAPVKIKVNHIKMENGFLCTKIKDGTFELMLEGKGSYTQLSLPE